MTEPTTLLGLLQNGDTGADGQFTPDLKSLSSGPADAPAPTKR